MYTRLPAPRVNDVHKTQVMTTFLSEYIKESATLYIDFSPLNGRF